MSRISENNSEDNKSSQDMEYNSESGIESETGEHTLSTLDQRDSILHVQFLMPHTFPKPYLTLNEVLQVTSDHVRNQNIAENPDKALCYIINHFNIDEVADSILKTPHYTFEQVYYSTYIDPHRFKRLQELIDLALKNFCNNALAQQWLAMHEYNIRNLTSDVLSPYLLQCLL